MSIVKKHFWLSEVWVPVVVPFPITPWHKTRNDRIYRFFLLKKEFELHDLVKYVWREQYLYFFGYKYSAFIRNFTKYLINELIERGILRETIFDRKLIYEVVRKPSRELINELCAYTWVVDPQD
ncbi:MAG: hypothetical protein DRJ03_12200 [Chloroflexi bacterium]|nr:MAG: hypothetical protein DRJ03_12175 [Chloroflexota bacterium]RLC85261.1 MAG: hypothetical protein DRJ03_12200 [Chloroflexota bacterium]